MYLNPTKTLKNYFLNFIRYFYQTDLHYTDDLVRKWVKYTVPLILDIFFSGFVGWLFLLSILALTPITWFQFSSGAWHILHIFQIGLIIWVGEKLYTFFVGNLKGLIHLEVNVRK